MKWLDRGIASSPAIQKMSGLEEKWTIEKLDGSNWTTWKFQMKHLLLAKGLWGVTEGTETVPDEANAETVSQHHRKLQKALTTIVLGICPTQLYLITSHEDPKEAWDALKQHFERDTLANKLFLKKQYFRAEMREGTSVEAHLKKMKELTDKLAAVGAPITEEDQVVTLLGSLPSNYAALVTALEARSDDLTLNYVQQALIHEEQKQKGQSVEQASSGKGDAALVGASRKQNPASFLKKIKCYNCNKYGHYKRNCPALVKQNSPPVHKAKLGRTVCAMGAFRADGQDQYPQRHHWLVDSGATSHMTWQKELLMDFQELSPPEKVGLGDGHSVHAVGIGKVRMEMDLDNRSTQPAVLHKVLYVPQLALNLFSVKAATKRGKKVDFGKRQCIIRGAKQQVCGKGTSRGNLYYLDAKPSVEFASVAVKKPEKIDLWHQRMGHVNEAQLKDMIQKEKVNGVSGISQKAELEFCEGCVKGKMHRQPFKPVGEIHSKRRLHMVHSDVCGPIQTVSLGGCKYFVTFVDDFSRFCSIYFMKNKSEVPEKFKEFKAAAENECKEKIAVLRTDRGGEFLSQSFEQFLKDQGIQHEMSVARCPEQNGVAERMNRTLVESARTMLLHAGLPKPFWAEAVATAAYLRNRMPTSALQDKATPYEKWYGRKPNLSYLKVFGCTAYAHIPDEERRKLDQKAEKLRFVGYAMQSKGYRLYSEKSGQVKIRRNVVFNETDFGWTSGNPPKEEILEIENEEDQEIMREPEDIPEVQDAPVVQQPRRSERQRKAPLRYGLDEFADPAGVSMEHQANHMAYRAVFTEEPKTLEEALKNEHAEKWKAAAESEYESLMENKTWKLVTLPAGKTPIGCRWIFKAKHGDKGQVERFKARLVARGFAQEYGIDYEETFAPVVRFTSIRTLLAFAVERGMLIHQMDVITAFLNGKLEEEIYMQQPEGFIKPGEENLVCKLNRSIYGLKQSPRCWNKELKSYMEKIGFKQSSADPCIFVRNAKCLTVVAVYVDDLILVSDTEEEMQKVKNDLAAQFKMKDMGQLHYCLGINIEQKKNGVLLMHQRRYILDLLKRYSLMDANPVSTPADVNVKLEKEDGFSNSVDTKLYQSMVGSLLYAALATRPDIAQAVGAVAKYCARPSEAHLTAVKRIFRYLKGTVDLGLKFKSQRNLSPVGYSDADWAGDRDDRHSTSGNLFLMASSPISWMSKKQSVVALSSAEAEYIALSSAAQETVWLRRLLEDLGAKSNLPTLIMEDNQGAIAQAQNPVAHGRSKHIDIKYHFVREAIEDGFVSLQYCSTKDMIADILTKPLVKCQFQKLRRMMGMEEIT